MSKLGELVVVGTPIGNMGDISRRATEALASADVVVCEDSRRAANLFSILSIAPVKCLVANEHSEHEVGSEVVSLLNNGKKLVLVTDAGMPAISDPGAKLVKMARSVGHKVTVVPGPSAVSAAMALTGFESVGYIFLGFLDKSGSQRQAQLNQIANSEMPVVFFESPKRVLKTLAELVKICDADREVFAGRELTKMHETIYIGTIAEVRNEIGESPKGEFVIVVDKAAKQIDWDEAEIRAQIKKALDAGVSRSQLSSDIAKLSGKSKKYVYDLSLQSSSQSSLQR